MCTNSPGHFGEFVPGTANPSDLAALGLPLTREALLRSLQVRIVSPTRKKRKQNHFDFARGDETGMKNARRSFSTLAAITMVVMPLLLTVYLLFCAPGICCPSGTVRRSCCWSTSQPVPAQTASRASRTPFTAMRALRSWAPASLTVRSKTPCRLTTGPGRIFMASASR